MNTNLSYEKVKRTKPQRPTGGGFDDDGDDKKRRNKAKRWTRSNNKRDIPVH